MSRLFDRAIVRLSPQDPAEDVRAFLQGLVTNDVAGDLPVWAALLTAQGKVLFDFIVWSDGDAGLLRLAHVPMQTARHVARCHPTRVKCGEEQRYRLALHSAQPTLVHLVGAADHTIPHELHMRG